MGLWTVWYVRGGRGGRGGDEETRGFTGTRRSRSKGRRRRREGEEKGVVVNGRGEVSFACGLILVRCRYSAAQDLLSGTVLVNRVLCFALLCLLGSPVRSFGLLWLVRIRVWRDC